MTDHNIQKELSINDIFFIIRRHKKIYLYVVLCIIFLGIFYHRIVTPTYESSSLIVIEEKDKSMSSLFKMGMGGEKNFLENEIQILKSRTIAEKTIEALINSDQGNNLILLNTAKPKYTPIGELVRKLLLVEKELPSSAAISDSLNKKIVEKLRLNTSISNPRNTDVLKVTVNGKSAQEASLITNTLVEVYRNRDQEWITGEMTYLEEFLDEQLIFKSAELSEIEEKLKNFQQDNKIYSLIGNSDLLLKQLTEIEAEYYKSEAEANILDKRKEYYLEQLNDDEKELLKNITNTTNTQLFSIRKELAVLEAEYVLAKSKDSYNTDALESQKNKISNIKKSLREEAFEYINFGISPSDPLQFRAALMDSLVQIDIMEKAFRQKQYELKNVVGEYNKKLEKLPKKSLEYARFERDKVILSETYSLMKTKLEEARIQKASQLGKVRIIDPASTPILPSSVGLPGMIIFCLFFGATAGLAVIFFMEYRDNTVKSVEEIERRGLSILAIIPFLKDSSKKDKEAKKVSSGNSITRRIIMDEDPKSVTAEAYRSLRTSLNLYNSTDNKIKTILITSSGPKEGKSTTASNLAITYALTGKKVLIIDTDLRKPVLHKIFNLDKSKGITSYLSEENKDINDFIQSSQIENVGILPCGPIPPNPSEMIGSDQFEALIEKLKKEWDYIILDTPPLIAVTDASILTKFADRVVLVIRAGITQKNALDRVQKTIAQSGFTPGIVLNGADETTSYYGGEYYNYYQYYYGEDEEKTKK